jgi:hypothetical protein
MLRELLEPQDQATLLQSIQQLALREPAAVYRHAADMINTGAMVRQRQYLARASGFPCRSNARPCPIFPPAGTLRLRNTGATLRREHLCK